MRDTPRIEFDIATTPLPTSVLYIPPSETDPERIEVARSRPAGDKILRAESIGMEIGLHAMRLLGDDTELTTKLASEVGLLLLGGARQKAVDEQRRLPTSMRVRRHRISLPNPNRVAGIDFVDSRAAAIVFKKQVMRAFAATARHRSVLEFGENPRKIAQAGRQSVVEMATAGLWGVLSPELDDMCSGTEEDILEGISLLAQVTSNGLFTDKDGSGKTSAALASTDSAASFAMRQLDKPVSDAFVSAQNIVISMNT